ncbi:hypothetical protein JCM8097_000153 [Rhodosporidiobolus ruineniae]
MRSTLLAALSTTLLFPFASAQSSDLTPRHHRHLPLPLRVHHHAPGSTHGHGHAHSHTHLLRKRDALDDLLCGIGLLSSCAEGNTPSTGIDTNSDPNNCGALGNVCRSSFANGIGAAACQLGVCITSCPSGYTYSTSGCIDTASDPDNCGAVGTACATNWTGGSGALCEQGECRPAACGVGYTYDAASRSCQVVQPTTTSSTTSTASTSEPVTPTSEPATPTTTTATAPTTTSDSSSPPSSSDSPSSPDGTATANPGLASASARARARLAKKSAAATPKTLCPSGLVACPIAGSASFYLAQLSPFSSTSFNSTLGAGEGTGKGGFECLDPLSELTSCGGCSSLSTGTDCSTLPHVRSAGCAEGRCVVFACERGWKPDEHAGACVRSREKREKKRARYGTAASHLHLGRASRHH